jgi:ParB family transcriptional regulator, chromosome partitioning protein
MTSGEFHSIPLSSITVTRETRQRRELTNIEELASSIDRLGLIHPLVVDREHILISGERRFMAVTSLGWTHVSCQYYDELDPYGKKELELDENVKRQDLPWQDRVAAVKELDEIYRARDPDWTITQTAERIGFSQQHISRFIAVAKEIEVNPEAAKEEKLSVAFGKITRREQHKTELAREMFLAPEIGVTYADSILVEDFLTWAPTYHGPRFNFIHCDFPYGIGADKAPQGASAAYGDYIDTEENYWNLCHCLAANAGRLCAESCHIVFWFSMDYYQQTLEFFDQFTNFKINPFPLIWHKTDNTGILPDPQRGPRRVYETALFGHSNDRKVVQAVANAYGAPVPSGTHMSEKSEPMLRHFFRMVVDESTRMLDPTCGSGSALRAAESLGAPFVLGLERDPGFAEGAKLSLLKARNLRRLG